MELVEGKYEPFQAPVNPHTDLGKMLVLGLQF